jgi:phosphotransferase system enzyme I (PtsI)
VAHLYDPLHPAVLQLVADTIRTATKAGIPVSVCGEIAGDPALTRLLLGFGLREFSMHPAQLLEVKQRVLGSNLADTEAQVKRMLRTEEPERLREQLVLLNA